MHKQSLQIPDEQKVILKSGATTLYYDSSIEKLSKITDVKKSIFLVDEIVFKSHAKKFKSLKAILVPSGEESKNFKTVENLILEIIKFGADRSTVLIGVGGGVVTDIVGFVAAVYMRGVPFGFVPTTILGMVDASIGGKNGIDFGLYKNLIGTIRQPQFILYDYQFLSSLPPAQWVNGFAEVIKHSCIKDAAMLQELGLNSISVYKKDPTVLKSLIQRNAGIKLAVVKKDEFESGDRKFLNFGHTFGHAIENNYQLLHGSAISIGMSMACKFSESILGFKNSKKIENALEQYELPIKIKYNKKKTLEIMKMDKKKLQSGVQFVLLEEIGKPRIVQLGWEEIKTLLK